jgi:hypothetical protein
VTHAVTWRHYGDGSALARSHRGAAAITVPLLLSLARPTAALRLAMCVWRGVGQAGIIVGEQDARRGP